MNPSTSWVRNGHDDWTILRTQRSCWTPNVVEYRLSWWFGQRVTTRDGFGSRRRGESGSHHNNGRENSPSLSHLPVSSVNTTNSYKPFSRICFVPCFFVSFYFDSNESPSQLRSTHFNPIVFASNYSLIIKCKSLLSHTIHSAEAMCEWKKRRKNRIKGGKKWRKRRIIVAAVQCGKSCEVWKSGMHTDSVFWSERIAFLQDSLPIREFFVVVHFSTIDSSRALSAFSLVWSGIHIVGYAQRLMDGFWQTCEIFLISYHLFFIVIFSAFCFVSIFL